MNQKDVFRKNLAMRFQLIISADAKSLKKTLTTYRFKIKECLKKKRAQKITNLSFIENRKQMNFQSQLD